MLVLSGVAKLAHEVSLLKHVRDPVLGDLKKSALLMLGPLRTLTRARFALGLAATLGLPALLALLHAWQASSVSVAVVASLLLLAALGGELLERVAFFAASAPPKMPGGIGA